MPAVGVNFPDGSGVLQDRAQFLGVPFDRLDFDAVIQKISETSAESKFKYVVTPNVDHVVKISRDQSARHVYDAAWLSLCDSKPIWAMSHVLNGNLYHVTGSDLTVRIFREVIKPGEKLALIVASEEVAANLIEAFPGLVIRTHVPPMGVGNSPEAFKACVDFVLQEDARFVFIGIGAPQSEMIAHALSQHLDARGIGFCFGASLEFMLGLKKRAPKWMQSLGLEWLHRLFSEPQRLWRRYILAVVPVTRLFLADLRRKRA